MSKSLGNVVSIKEFLSKYSANVLRFLCVKTHYRSDMIYDEKLLEAAQALDSKIKHVLSTLNSKLDLLSHENLNDLAKSGEVSSVIGETEEEIIDGICDDLDLNRGLQAMYNLLKVVDLKESPLTIIAAKILLHRWFSALGVDYLEKQELKHSKVLVTLVSKFRSDVRRQSLNIVKKAKTKDEKENAQNLLMLCDALRADMRNNGIVFVDDSHKT